MPDEAYLNLPWAVALLMLYELVRLKSSLQGFLYPETPYAFSVFVLDDISQNYRHWRQRSYLRHRLLQLVGLL